MQGAPARMQEFMPPFQPLMLQSVLVIGPAQPSLNKQPSSPNVLREMLALVIVEARTLIVHDFRKNTPAAGLSVQGRHPKFQAWTTVPTNQSG